MVNVLYSVTAFVCSLVLIILPMRIRRNLKKENPVDKAFLALINWTAAFCMIDCIWGVLASWLIKNSLLLFVFSAVFHLCAAFTPLLWLNYVLVYLGGTRFEKVYRIFFDILFLVQCVLLIINFFNHMMFYVDDTGIYVSTPVRRLLFYMQYFTYVLIAAYSMVRYFKGKHTEENLDQKEKLPGNSYLYVIMFVAAPILTGIFQMIYPDAPAYSIGYMLGCCIIYSFVVTDMLNARMIENAVAQASSKAKTEFLFNMSHDIRTPMNAILGYTDIAINHIDEKERVSDSLKKIKTSGGHLLSLINDILEMSRIEAGRLEIVNAPLNIYEVSEGVINMSQALASTKDITFNAEILELKNPYVYADELHTNQVIINLISNAIKYTNPGGTVNYRIEQISNVENEIANYRITVRDNGTGMSEEFQKHLFESFAREKTVTVSKQEEAGLGLAIVKRIIDLTGGKIKAESKQGEGSKFTVELPLKVMDDTAIEAFEASRKEDTVTEADTSFEGKKVLLVEDNEMNREIATEILEENGMIVECAEDGAIAVGRVKERGVKYFDFILMDIQMPVMNGYEATTEIRKLPEGDKVTIIALSANAFKEDIEKSLSAGMNDHVAKPINIKELLNALAKFKM